MKFQLHTQCSYNAYYTAVSSTHITAVMMTRQYYSVTYYIFLYLGQWTIFVYLANPNPNPLR